MKILKPSLWGDSYYRYKSFIAIVILAVVDARCIFTYIDAGRAGSIGDAYTYNHSSLKHRISSGQWLRHPGRIIKDVLVKPYLVGDSAFALSPYLIKGFQYLPQLGLQANFNAAVSAARKVSEIAFGRLKGRFHILVDNRINDPLFTSDTALSCAVLHNVCSRAKCPFETSWFPDETLYSGGAHPPAAQAIAAVHEGPAMRSALATYIQDS